VFLDKHKELKVFLIFSDERGEINTYITNNLKEQIKNVSDL
jgi:hypothetical protein